jgi:hypothetical protein
VLHRALSWFESPLVFLHSAEAMESESTSLDENAGDDWESRYFHVTRAGQRLGLPWSDAGLAFCIAVNRVPGDRLEADGQYPQISGELFALRRVPA